MKLRYFLLSLAAYLFFIAGCLVFATKASADDGMEKLAQESADKVDREHPYITYRRVEVYRNRQYHCPVNQLPDEDTLCPSGWKASPYFLITKADASPKTPSGYVEVCPDNQLIRIKK